MGEWLSFIAEQVVLVINGIVLLTITLGTAIAAVQAAIAVVTRSTGNGRLREIYLQYGHWLIAALTFQVAADILESSTAPTWPDVGRLAAIAAIRVFLNYFLEVDLERAERLAERKEKRAS
jgi:uncharacterized membrane protein